MSFRAYIRETFSRPMVRPWALAAPILILVLALPLLRPLRHPADVSADESLRLATIQSLVEHKSLALTSTPSAADRSQLLIVDGKIHADQPPMLALLLTGPEWVMKRMHITTRENGSLVAYVLTLLGVTLPVAGAAGLIYRMGRLFELTRPWRAALGLIVVIGSGLISYSVVLNPHAPAAVLVLCSAACLIHVGLAKLPRHGISWITLAGLCAALAAALDPPAIAIALLLFAAVATLRLSIVHRAIGVTMFLVGASIPIFVHASWSYPINGQVIPGWSPARTLAMSEVDTAAPLPRATLTLQPVTAVIKSQPTPADLAEIDADDVIAPPTRFDLFMRHVEWTWSAFFGAHGLLSHFPVLLVGIAGVGAVMHRHWPRFVKTLAAATAIGAIGVLLMYGWNLTDWRAAMFASRWFVLFLPMLLFWSGAWLRRTHKPASWTLAAVLLTFSSAVAIVGMTEPYPKDGFDRYTAFQALTRLVHTAPPEVIARR